jgi:hypothetical protein
VVPGSSSVFFNNENCGREELRFYNDLQTTASY